MDFVIGRDPNPSLSLLIPSFSKLDNRRPIKGKQTFYHFWARNALYHGIRFLGLTPGQKVLVPAFHCATMIDPFLILGLDVIYYNIFRDGSPDFKDIQTKIDRETRALVAIHFFGIAQPIQQLRELCQQHRMFLIEDCAHILVGEVDGVSLGSFGDISVFSWRKLLPLYDGGLLVVNNPRSQINVNWDRSDVWFQLKVAKNLLEKSLARSSRLSKFFSFLGQSALSLLRRSSKTQRVTRKAETINSYSATFDDSLANLPMSRFSQNIIKRVDFSQICERRRQNSIKISNAISSWPDVHPWSKTIPEKICGWGFPIVTHRKKNVHLTLRERGIQAFTWEGVIHPTLMLHDFPDVEFLYRHLIILPNHQDLTDENMEFLIRNLRESVR